MRRSVVATGDEEHRRWPGWWEWDLEVSVHMLERMVDRGCSEVDLRGMIESARRLREDHEAGRWVVETSLESRREVILEPDAVNRVLVVITAYPVDLT